MSALFFETALLPAGWSADVRVELAPDGSVVSVAPEAEADGAARVDGVAVPGVPNLHSHAFQRALAGLAERGSPTGDTFWSWRDRMYRFLEELTPEDVEAIAAQLFVELLRHGYTAVAEFHYLRNAPGGAVYADPAEMARRVATAAGRAGIGLTLLPTLYRSGDFGGAMPRGGQLRFVSRTEALLGDIERLAVDYGADPNLRLGLGLHSLRAVPPEDLSAAVTALDRIDATAPIHIHVAEQAKEVEGCIRWCGSRPVEWLLGNAPVDARWCLVHATHMTPPETLGVADSGAVVGLCPTTEANLGDGTFPFAEHLEVGGRWGVGSDSHVSRSPVAELRALEYGQRLLRQMRNVAAGPRDVSTGRSLLDAACSGGARACGRPVGHIEAGHRADIVVLDPAHPALAGRKGDELVDSWIFSGEETPVRHVFVGGRQVVTDGRHAREDEIASRYREVVQRLAEGA